jgi:isocitrate dehydrogenase kinase/phosphatase
MKAPVLDSNVAQEMAQALLHGFERHYRLFRESSASAKPRFEQRNWSEQQSAQRERIAFYDQRVAETVAQLTEQFAAGSQPTAVWQQVKLLFIGMLVGHHQPELAETFFNSVTTKILHRHYFRNDFIFVRPAISTEYLEADDTPTYRAYYPKRNELAASMQQMLLDFGLTVPFVAIEADAQRVARAFERQLGRGRMRPNFQVQVLDSLFFRNKGAYLVGKLINGFQEEPFALALLHPSADGVVVDAALFGAAELQILFSFTRAYFMVDMQVPSAYVQFLRTLMPRKPRAELYNALGLAKQGKTLFYRDFLHHLRHSTDRFRVAPGIKGMVMMVFDLPSFPFVFKVIKDHYPPQKETTREQIKDKYLLVKQHDRVGRMADTMEYSLVAFPLARFEPALLQELQAQVGSQLEFSDPNPAQADEVVIRHVYIERRMIPLNIYLQEVFDALNERPDDAATLQQLQHVVVEYGNAIKEMVAANIFPGDMLWKNFGVTRHGKVVFYDYDEIEYITDCNFREVPPPRNEEDEMSGEIWYAVGPRDVFPETFAPFLLGNAKVRDVFMAAHADLLDPAYWRMHQERIKQGHISDVYPYEAHSRLTVETPTAQEVSA